MAPTSGFGDPATVVTIDAQGNANWVGGAWYVPLPVSAGDTIGTVTAVVRDNAPSTAEPAGNNVLAYLVSRTPTGDTTRAFTSSNGSGSQQTLTLTPSGGYKVQAGDEMLVEFKGLSGGAIPGPSTAPSMTGTVTVSPLIPPPSAGGSLVIPVAPPTLGPARSSLFATVTGVGSSGTTLVVPLPLTSGQVMTRLRARIKDDGVGAKIQMSLVRTTDNSETFSTLVASPASSGLGTEEYVTINGGPDGSALSISASTHYYAVFANSAGTSTSSSTIYRLEEN